MDSKIENFDFYELTAGLFNSLIDQIYRAYYPHFLNAYNQLDEKDREFNLNGARNDLDVENIVKGIKQKVEGELADKAAELVVAQVLKELKEQYYVEPNSTERFFDRVFKGMRWLMAIPFLCVALVLVAYMFVVFAETMHMMNNSINYVSAVYGSNDGIPVKSSLDKVIASMLLVLDLFLVGSLVIMVLAGGYINTISRIGTSHDVPTWFRNFDIHQMKIKVATSIIIISSIHLLMSFMQLDVFSSESLDFKTLMWATSIHAVFIVSGVGIVYMDKIHRS